MFKYKAAAALAAALTTTAPFVGAFAQVATPRDVPRLQARDPSDPNATAPAARYTSAFTKYRPNVEAEVGSWREKNDEVRRIGGWRVYGREAIADSNAAEKPSGDAKAARDLAPKPAQGHVHPGVK
jgi:hypothetical protein